MGLQAQPVDAICISSQVDAGSAYVAAALRYFWLRQQSLRTGHANVPMVRLGMGDPLDGFDLDLEVDEAMAKWPLPANHFQTAAPVPAHDYELTSIEAEFLSKVVEASTHERETLLSRYANSAGVDDVIRLFSQMIGCANAVIENCRLGAIDLLITEGGLHPHVAEDINLPTLVGAMSGVMLAAGVDPREVCSGCVYRHGTHANQSAVTTEDAAYSAFGSLKFMCHENLDQRGSPTRVCVGHAKALKAVNEAECELSRSSTCIEPQSIREAVTGRAWSQSIPSRPGSYWNWGGQPGVEAELVQVRLDTAAGCFSVSEGQLGLVKALPCAQWGGWWAPVQKPDAYSEIGGDNGAHSSTSKVG
ncbi:hypothetical protein FQ186_25990 [Pseudomonas sp. ANT_H14]|uniref:hypothetical protein n=1 Tax=unclassified Pseudomonas TaxID=196821 RepID=UPI0011EF8907|nr:MULTISPECIES: hypothetical protein [unclassified Pseudomonas]KAA0946206.1 hypothetical protein FQ182_13560 [Pseudomonas sp. ANT_H4]KAA0947158.1 hypothetical protein FQ186_25990 [Pseudomonas sp. ANT_H14]